MKRYSLTLVRRNTLYKQLVTKTFTYIKKTKKQNRTLSVVFCRKDRIIANNNCIHTVAPTPRHKDTHIRTPASLPSPTLQLVNCQYFEQQQQ